MTDFYTHRHIAEETQAMLRKTITVTTRAQIVVPISTHRVSGSMSPSPPTVKRGCRPAALDDQLD